MVAELAGPYGDFILVGIILGAIAAGLSINQV